MNTDSAAGLVDQQVLGIAKNFSGWFGNLDEGRKLSKAFVVLCLCRALNLSPEDAFDALTDGPDDAGVDGLVIGEVSDGEFPVTILQAKYKKNLDGSFNFPATAIQTVVSTCLHLFDPHVKIRSNASLQPKIEEIRSLILEGYLPVIRVILCSNGLKWGEDGQAIINRIQEKIPDVITFEHFNHRDIVAVGRRARPVDAQLRLSGKMIVEDQEFKRILIGRVRVSELVKLYAQYGDLLLQKNIRRFLGFRDNRVNEAIRETLLSDKTNQFYFYNNGITAVCSHFAYNALQQSDHIVSLKDLQIINGGQTCRTIFETLKDFDESQMPNASLLLRIYQIEAEDTHFVQAVTFATNSQNPVELRDLHSNDAQQKDLEMGCKELGYVYKRQRDASLDTNSKILPSTVVAEAVLAVWRKKPHQGRFFRRQHFGRLYDEIFNSLNAAQAILATLIFRDVEARRRQFDTQKPAFVAYASDYLAMLSGESLLKAANIELSALTHRNFEQLLQLWETNKNAFYDTAMKRIQDGLSQLYGDREVELRQLSATFRRGDLLQWIPSIRS